MGLFGFGKKKEQENKAPACACQCGCGAAEVTTAAPTPCCDGALSVKVLGTGCASCHALLENTKAAVADLGLDAQVEYVTDIAQIAASGVMSMPALVVNGKPVVTGKVLKPAEVAAILEQARS